jgi:hypothetical protein
VVVGLGVRCESGAGAIWVCVFVLGFWWEPGGGEDGTGSTTLLDWIELECEVYDGCGSSGSFDLGLRQSWGLSSI